MVTSVVPWRAYWPMVALAVGMGVASVSAAIALDLPWRDPDGTFGPSYVRLPAIVLGAFLADVVPRAIYRALGLRRAWPLARAVVRERWTRGRVALVLLGVACFYLTYVSYRVLKGYLPFIREDIKDEQLAQLDAWLSFGRPPSDVLHGLLGTGISAHVLSLIYVGYLLFVPLSLAVWLVWSRNLAGGLWYATALCANWALGLVSYYLIPSQGPIFAEPSLFWDLPDTGVSALQAGLWNTRWFAITDPQGYDGVFSIAGFASLHVSVVFTAALLAHMTIRSAWVRWAMWVFLVATVLATLYFGWHYIADDVAGLAIGWIAVWFGARATGHSMRGNYRGQMFGHGAQTAQPAQPLGAGRDRRSAVG